MVTSSITKEEILKIAKENVPEDLEIDVKENEDGFVLMLKDSKYEVDTIIPKIKYTGARNEEAEKFVAEKTREKIIQKISDFGTSEADAILEKFSLDDHFRQKYADKNILYKVKRKYTLVKTDNLTHTVNFGLYYIHRVRDLIKTYHPILKLFLVEKAKHDKSEEIIEILFSAMLRFEQLLFAFDRIEDMTRDSTRDNDVLFIVNFHLYYFISLAKTLGDNLAWLLMLYCNFDIKYTNIDLLSESFKALLCQNNRYLHDIIFNHQLYPNYKKIKDYRNIIQHRQALHVVPVMLGINGPEKIMVPKDPESLVPYGLRINKQYEAIFAKAEDAESMVEYGALETVLYAGHPEDIPYEEPVVFCKRYIEFLSDIFTNVFERIIVELKRKPIGKITNYLAQKGVAVVELADKITKGDSIMIEGNTTSFLQTVESLQIDRKPVDSAEKELVGLKVDTPVRRNDIIYKV